MTSEKMFSKRASGVLLHPTSLPGKYGIGELGSEAFEFVEFLRNAGQSLWQILPLNPPGAGGSPYSSPSAFAGNPLLISTERLVSGGLAEAPAPSEPGPVDFASAAPGKMERLRMAYSRWRPDEAFEAFREENRFWLGDYALFMALKGKLEKPWNEWPESLARREAAALAEARRELEPDILFHTFAQFRFFEDWRGVKKTANESGVSIIGDVPIFISHDSADVWSNRELFLLDEGGHPSVAAGVPPDYFSETGQLWGNPLYRWDMMRADKYSWWTARVAHALSSCDALRLDHFRGFEAHWEVPAEEETAINGRWVAGPGKNLFDALESSLGELPLIAEDLGDITPEVARLRESLGFPGMKVLQFGFSEPENHFLPHNYGVDTNWVAYTGTHDNDTTAGWWRNADEKERSFARKYLGKEYVGAEDFIRLAHSSTAKWSVVPMQDLLGLGSEARMNTPGTAEGNWRWRMEGKAPPELAARMREVAEVYGRSK